MASIAVAAKGGVELEPALKLAGICAHLITKAAQIELIHRGRPRRKMVAHADGIVLAPAEVEALGSLGDWRQQGVHVRDRTVVEIGRRRPDAIEGTDLVGQRSLDAIGPVTIQGFPFLLRNRRIRVSYQYVTTFATNSPRAGPNLSVLIPEIGRNRHLTILHVLRLSRISADLLDIDRLHVKVSLAEFVRRQPGFRIPELTRLDGRQMAARAVLVVECGAFVLALHQSGRIPPPAIWARSAR